MPRPFIRICWFALSFIAAAALMLIAGSRCIAAPGQILFVSDKTGDFNEPILKYSADGTFLGNLGSGAPVFGPVGLAVDAAGNLYVANSNSNTIIRYSSSGAYLGVFASSGLALPDGCVFDSGGNLIVCNYLDGSLSKYSPAGVLLWHASAGVVNAAAIALDSHNNIYVSNDNQGPGYGVFRFAPDGTGKTLFATGPTLDARGLAFDSLDRLYVVNTYDDSIRRFALNGTDLGVFASTGLNQPYAVAFDALGELYVSNQLGGGIHHFSATGSDLGTFALVQTSPANPVGLVFSPVPEPRCIFLIVFGLAIYWAIGRLKQSATIVFVVRCAPNASRYNPW